MPLTGLKVCGKISAFFLSNKDAKTANYLPRFCKIVAQISCQKAARDVLRPCPSLHAASFKRLGSVSARRGDSLLQWLQA